MFVCDINNQKGWGQSYEGAESRYVSTVDFFCILLKLIWYKVTLEYYNFTVLNVMIPMATTKTVEYTQKEMRKEFKRFATKS